MSDPKIEVELIYPFEIQAELCYKNESQVIVPDPDPDPDPLPPSQETSNNLIVSTARYVGSIGEDLATGVAINNENEVILSGNFANPINESDIFYALDGSETSRGRLLRFNLINQSIISELVIGDRIDDLVYCEQLSMVVVSGSFGVIALSSAIDAILWHNELLDTNDNATTRIDVADNGTVIAMRDGKLRLINILGDEIARGTSNNDFVTDVATNQVGDTFYVTSFSNNFRNGIPVQIAKLSVLSVSGFTITEDWKLFDFPSQDVGADMADTRLYRVTRGADDSIYIAGESAGGNSIFRWNGVDLSTPRLVLRAPYFHAYNTRANHITYYAKVDLINREVEKGQFVLARLSSGVGNTIRVRDGDLKIDSNGNFLVSGASAASMQNRSSHQINGITIGGYAGGDPYLLVVSSDLRSTLRWTGFISPFNTNQTNGTINALAVKGDLVVLFGSVTKGEFYTTNNDSRIDSVTDGVSDCYLVVADLSAQDESEAMLSQIIQLGEDIEAYRAVTIINGQLFKASVDDPLKYNVVGIIQDSGLAGESKIVQTGGTVNNTNWAWIASSQNRIYLSTDGQLTQVIPTIDVLVEIGYPIDSTSIVLDIEEPILL